jgi:hypothetical protein
MVATIGETNTLTEVLSNRCADIVSKANLVLFSGSKLATEEWDNPLWVPFAKKMGAVIGDCVKFSNEETRRVGSSSR